MIHNDPERSCISICGKKYGSHVLNLGIFVASVLLTDTKAQQRCDKAKALGNAKNAQKAEQTLRATITASPLHMYLYKFFEVRIVLCRYVLYIQYISTYVCRSFS